MDSIITTEAYEAFSELCEAAGFAKAGNKSSRNGIVVIGCSTSEVCGGDIGHASSPETAQQIYDGISKAAAEYGVYIAAQCCEHLNRAIVIERAAVEAQLALASVVTPDFYEVNVVPQPKAGGSFATAAYHAFSEPAVISGIRADAGIDIGGTLIGMHLKAVAVPVKLRHNKIGSAGITAARTRLPYTGGSRAIYNAEL